MCYCIASVPVCVFCDGRTHGQTHNPILSGIRCFLRRNARARNNDANSQIIRSSDKITSVPARSFASDTYSIVRDTVGRSCERVCGPVAEEIKKKTQKKTEDR